VSRVTLIERQGNEGKRGGRSFMSVARSPNERRDAVTVRESIPNTFLRNAVLPAPGLETGRTKSAGAQEGKATSKQGQRERRDSWCPLR